MAYKNIHEKFWTDIDLRRLSIEDKYLFFYLITSPYSHFSGVYYISISSIVEGTGLSKNKVRESLKRLSNIKDVKNRDRVSGGYQEGIKRVSGGYQEGSQRVSGGYQEGWRDYFLLYDDVFKIVWVKNCLRYQIVGRFSPQQIKAVENHLATLQPSYLVKLFINYYKDLFGLTFFYQERYPISTFSKKSAVSVSVSVSEDSIQKTEDSIQYIGDKVVFDFNEKKFKNLEDGKIKFYKEKLPAVDVEAEILKMECWIVSNPKNKKSNYERFIFNWLCRAQDNAKVKKVNPFDQI